MYVDLPPMFGPVINMILLLFSSKKVELGTKSPFEITFSTTGCLPSLILIISELSITGLQYLFLSDISAKEESTSIVDNNFEMLANRSEDKFIVFRISQNISYSNCISFCSDPRIFDSICFKSSVINLSQFTNVCLLIK